MVVMCRVESSSMEREANNKSSMRQEMKFPLTFCEGSILPNEFQTHPMSFNVLITSRVNLKCHFFVHTY